MKRLLKLLLFFILSVSVTACGNVQNGQNSLAQEEPDLAAAESDKQKTNVSVPESDGKDDGEPDSELESDSEMQPTQQAYPVLKRKILMEHFLKWRKNTMSLCRSFASVMGKAYSRPASCGKINTKSEILRTGRQDIVLSCYLTRMERNSAGSTLISKFFMI